MAHESIPDLSNESTEATQRYLESSASPDLDTECWKFGVAAPCENTKAIRAEVRVLATLNSTCGVSPTVRGTLCQLYVYTSKDLNALVDLFVA